MWKGLYKVIQTYHLTLLACLDNKFTFKQLSISIKVPKSKIFFYFVPQNRSASREI